MEKSNFSEWYLWVARDGGFIDQRTPVRGCDVFLWWGYGVWEEIQKKADALFKEHGVRNYYFPMFIPESLLEKEAKHFEGFVPEVAWVTEGGSEKLSEKLAIRPTSETIVYYMFSQWVRSWRDLPLRVNQWCNVVRWETKATRPFLRSREFLWQEGHTAHASFEESEEEVLAIIEIYKKVIEGYCALPCFVLKRTESDKFAGALYSIAFDTFCPEAGRFIQAGTVHNLGQNFSKAFEINFLDKDQEEKHVWQTSWGFSTRLIGAIIAVHGDDKGAILPPEVAPIQVIIIPIPFKGREETVYEKSREVFEKLRSMGVRAFLDDRDEYTPGWKFNEWELKGVPLRIEIGPKDVEKGVVTIVRRDTGEKKELKDLDEVPELLKEIQENLYKKALKKMKESIVETKTLEEVEKAVSEKKIARAFWCGSAECEEKVKETGGEIRGTPFLEIEVPEGPCVACGKKATHVVYIGKSY